VLAFSLPIQSIHNLVIGENTTAFAAGGLSTSPNGRLVSFDMSTGTLSWTYDSTFGGSAGNWVDTVAAAPDNSLRATEGFYKEGRVAFTLDATGVRTDDPVSGDQITFLTSAGIGSSTWMGTDQTTVASLEGFEATLGLPAFMQSGFSITSPGITAFVSKLLAPINSTYPIGSTDKPLGQEGVPKTQLKLQWLNQDDGADKAVQFIFYSSYPHVASDNPPDVVSLSSGQVTLLKNTALNAFRRDYRTFNVFVCEVGTKDCDGSTNSPPKKKIVQVVGELAGACGLSLEGAGIGVAYYRVVLQDAQSALQIGTLSSVLIHALGEGIGNTVAHEMAHLLAVPSPPMDIPTPNVLNGGNCPDRSNFTGVVGTLGGQPLYIWWDATTAKILDRILNPGSH
jgi:hypothetical protein